MELATRARWCRHYAELNYLALRKIAKKRDRLLGGKIGEEFIQVVSKTERFRHLALLSLWQCFSTANYILHQKV